MIDLRSQRGDTLVEVLISTVIISIVLAGAFALSNRATRLNQTAFEKTEISNQMREQAELIKTIATQNASEYTDLLARVNVPPSTVPPVACTPRVSDAFYIDPASLTVENYGHNADVTAVTDAYNDIFRVWVEGADPSGSGYVDFHIRGCWQGAGSQGEQLTGMVVRIPT